MVSNSLLVHFAGNAVRFQVENKAIRDALKFHFRHTLRTKLSPIAEYEITALENDQFSASLNGETFFSKLNFQVALWQLSQDAITQLNGSASEELVFHAAALAHQDNALILCGKSGSGKSSLAAWLVAKDLSYMTDEVISRPIDAENIHGLSRSIVLKSGSAFIWQHWLKDAPRDAMLRFSDDSVWIEPNFFNHANIKPTATPRILLFPRYEADADFQVKRISNADALFRLLQNLVNARNFPDHGLAETSRLARQVTAYEMVFSDIERASEWIEKSLKKG